MNEGRTDVFKRPNFNFSNTDQSDFSQWKDTQNPLNQPNPL